MSEVLKQESGMSLLVECEDCGNRFRIGMADAIVQVTHKKEYKVNGRSIFLTYYDCPKCGRRHYAQIDDVRSLQMMRESSRVFVRLAAKRKNGKQIPQSQSVKWKKQQQHLSDYRKKLMTEFTGTTITEETGESFVLRFSI